METIFRDKFVDNSTYDPLYVENSILREILIHVHNIKKRQIKDDQILQQQWFMVDVRLNPSNEDKDEWREETIFNSTQALLKIATDNFIINNDATMIQFFKALFPD